MEFVAVKEEPIEDEEIEPEDSTDFESYSKQENVTEIPEETIPKQEYPESFVNDTTGRELGSAGTSWEETALGFQSDLDTVNTTGQFEHEQSLSVRNEDTNTSLPLINAWEFAKQELIEGPAALTADSKEYQKDPTNKNPKVGQQKGTKKSCRKPKVLKFGCEYCDRTFPILSRLKTHLLSHTGEKPFTCELCLNRFTRKCDLNKHVLSHGETKPFVCEICFKGFTQKPAWTYHMLEHSGIKPFTCNQCNKSYTRKDRLQSHLLRHSGTRRFCCEFCSRTFSESWHLKTHLKIHSGVREFVCDICNMTFSLKPTLQSHMLIHTGEKAFTCNICNRSFARKKYLKSHSAVHTGIHKYNCSTCGKSWREKKRFIEHLCEPSVSNTSTTTPVLVKSEPSESGEYSVPD